MDSFKTVSGQENSMMPDQVAARCALVLETNNLRGGADAEAKTSTSLQRLVALLARQRLPLTALAQVVVTHDGLSPATCEAVSRLAGRPVDFVRIDHSTGYYDAKNVGFEATDAQRCTHVVFADADCLPDDDWLLQMLLPFTRADAPAVVAGRTSYAANVVGTALTTIDFMYFPNADHAGATSNFYANNVAFRREVFAQHSYQALDGVYRAHCQVLGMRLKAAGVPIHYAAQAHTEHRLPDTRAEALKLRWMRGQDTYSLTPHLLRSYVSPRWQWLARSGPIGPLAVLFTRLGFSVKALNHQDLPPLRGLRWLAGVALILGFSAVDMLGAFARGIGWHTTGRTNADAQALSYHKP
jgi:hypothetical protein